MTTNFGGSLTVVSREGGTALAVDFLAARGRARIRLETIVWYDNDIMMYGWLVIWYGSSSLLAGWLCDFWLSNETRGRLAAI